jgi:hypothetical protein
MSAFGRQTHFDIVSRIDLLRTGHHRRPILVAEGDTDVNVFKRHLQELETLAIISAEGKQNARKAAEAGDARWDSSVVFVVDADYDRLLGKSPTKHRILFTDHNDMECTITAYGGLRLIVDDLFSTQEQIEICSAEGVSSLPELVIRAAARVGRYRLANAHGRLSLRLQELKATELLAADRFRVDEVALRRWIINQNMPDRAEKLADMWSAIDSGMLPPADELDLCRGHDLIEMLRALIARYPSHRRNQWHCGPAETCLRLSFDSVMFRATHMGKDLLDRFCAAVPRSSRHFDAGASADSASV